MICRHEWKVCWRHGQGNFWGVAHLEGGVTTASMDADRFRGVRLGMHVHAGHHREEKPSQDDQGNNTYKMSGLSSLHHSGTSISQHSLAGQGRHHSVMFGFFTYTQLLGRVKRRTVCRHHACFAYREHRTEWYVDWVGHHVLNGRPPTNTIHDRLPNVIHLNQPFPAESRG